MDCNSRFKVLIKATNILDIFLHSQIHFLSDLRPLIVPNYGSSFDNDDNILMIPHLFNSIPPELLLLAVTNTFPMHCQQHTTIIFFD